MKEAVTKVTDTLTQADFYGAFQKLLERSNKCIAAGEDNFEGDYSFMCVLWIKMPIRKKSGNLLCSPCIYIYKYIYWFEAPVMSWPAMKSRSTAMTQRPRDRVPSGSMLALPDPRIPDSANPPTKFWWPLFFASTDMINMYWVPTGQTVNKEYYFEVLREFSKRFSQKRPAIFKSGQWHFH